MVSLVKLSNPQTALTGEIDRGVNIELLQYNDGYAKVSISYRNSCISKICHYDVNILTAYVRGEVDHVIDLIMKSHYLSDDIQRS